MLEKISSLDLKVAMTDEIREALQAIVFPEKDHDFDLVAALRKLDEVVAGDRINLHPRLRHFLENRSY